MKPSEKINALRRLMKERGLEAWIVPSADPHQSEYVAEHWQARAWLSGFRGSAGTLVVTQTRAGLWTDPRYHMRAAAELAGSGIELFKLGLPGVPTYPEWLCQELPPGCDCWVDGSVLSAAEAALLQEALGGSGIDINLYARSGGRALAGPPGPAAGRDHSAGGGLCRGKPGRKAGQDPRRHAAGRRELPPAVRAG